MTDETKAPEPSQISSPMQQSAEMNALTEQAAKGIADATAEQVELNRLHELRAKLPPFNPDAYRTGLDFGYALIALKAGHQVRRAGWLAPHWFCYIDPRIPGRILLISDRAELTNEDLLSTDWEIVR